MFKPKKIVISNHVVQRLRQRFYWKFHNYFGSTEMTRSLIYAQVSKGAKLDDWKMVPFYVNRIATKYGMGTEIIRMSGVYYICKYDGSTLFVKTCVEKFLNYN